MVNDEEFDKKLGIYSIESECCGEDWIHVKMIVSLKFRLKMLFYKYIGFYFKKVK